MPYFPQIPLPVHVSIAPGAEPAGDPDDWEADGLWTEITSLVREDQGITIEGGRKDEADQVDTTRCTMTVDNRNGDFSPRNPNGQWYGLLKKNTPIKVEVDILKDTFQRTATGDWGSTTDFQAATWTGATDTANVTYAVSGGEATATFVSAGFFVIPRLSMPAGWNTDVRSLQWIVGGVPSGGNDSVGITVRQSNSTSYQWRILATFKTDGTIDALIQRRDNASTFTITTVATGLTFTGSQKVWIRARAFGPKIQGKVWFDGTTEPAAWTVEFVETNPALAYDTSDGNLFIYNGVFFNRGVGNTNTTAIKMSSYTSTSPVFVGNVVEWPVRWDQSGNDCLVPLTASGVLRRLQQGASPLASPIYRTFSAHTPYAYWPLEDQSGSGTALGVGPGVKPATLFEAPLGWTGGTALGGASSTVEVTENTTIAGVLPTTNLPNNSWMVGFFLYAAAIPPLPARPLVLNIRSAGTIKAWNVFFSADLSNTVFLRAVDTDDNEHFNFGETASFTPGVWHYVQLEAFQNGSVVGAIISTLNLETGVFEFTFGNTATNQTLGVPNTWAIYGDSTGFPEGSVAHVAFYNRRSIFSVPELLAAGVGYAGETASERVERLCTENDVNIELLGDSTTVMGPQRSDTFLGLLRECEETDLGILYETAHTPGLGFRPRAVRYLTVPRVSFPLDQGWISAPLEPTDDDQRVRNDWTVSRPDGSSARVVDETHVTEHGRYDDSAEINVQSDDVLTDHAAFRVYLGTADYLRWPSVSFNLAKTPTVIPYWLSWLVGTEIYLANTPDQLPFSVVSVLVEGWTQTLSTYGWDLEISGSPGEVWNPTSFAIGPNTVTARDIVVDSDVSTLNASATSSATSISVAGTALWTTTSANWPFTITVGGEEMSVTAVSGSSSPQTFAVTRSTNGIVKAHSAGETVELAAPAIVVL